MRQLYSHPDKLLKDHLYNVYKLGMEKFRSKNLNFNNVDEIELMTKVILISHDFGKANEFFQRKLQLSTKGKTKCKEYQELTKQGKNKSNHSLLSALFAYYILDELIDDSLLSLFGMIIVYRHHGNLNDFRDMIRVKDWRLLEEQFVTVPLESLQEILDRVSLEVDITNLTFDEFKDKLDSYRFRRKVRKLKKILVEESNYLIVNLIYSILISSDKAEAIFYSKGLSYDKLEELVLSRREVDSEVIDKYKRLKGWNEPENKMDEQRNKIYDEVIENGMTADLSEDRILSINVPTGTGKTLSSLATGLKLRERVGQNYRLIYTLPFTSIIDQNFDVFTDVFSKTGLQVDNSLLIKHHYLTPKSYSKDDYDDEEYDISKHLIESWNSEIIVTTFVQLLHSIFSNQNRSLLKFYNISNSIILLDEVQNIPHRYWELVKIMLQEIAYKLDCYFIFITATMPLIYSEQEKEIKELAINKREHFQFFDRIKLDLSEMKDEKTLDEFKEFIIWELEDYSNKNFLIILNTIKTSIEIYEYINELVEDGIIEGETIYLSSNIVPKEREKRIKKIGNSNQRQIIISTQMVEAGVDIDLDRVYRDFGPLDAINQTCGRCNRNFDSDKKGVVTLVKLINEDHDDILYASYIYGKTLLRNTDELLSQLPDIVKEKEFFKINKEYFKKVDDVKSNDVSINLLDKIKKLKYKKAFWNDEDEKGEVFNLIEQDFETVNIFIELDEKAHEIWRQYRSINEMEINRVDDYSKRKAKFEEIKREFLGYVITIPTQVAREQLEDEELENTFNLVDFDQYETIYDERTGFKRDKTEVDTFF
ncbi:MULTISPECIES: CRISPR-associated helicase/endonuclease Cas3 [unclassified Candidatus Frackibacter]|uniref:CRISPR-associated helicase/endonuclease Cas3 n=1 Tax=unclassified Candidatus Frackibacter TaxID=2648818 RepID=UPI00088F1943|nr:MULTISPECIES: CRISPR-associated helicase/endonuclease Cas3 [unclassified Candidatus Frackibacter]SDC86109.1 CRISPR-associated helicase, Cas3 family [Candidatus Frackibacter sp. WG11]SEN00413.1 CRISPR-associated helicase, Cas3 family [Candidatus Frackibacter sp. WG12]SFL55788.1 CRISPR-associated helicase, Cas3 family [Candidatus Frackibacter sp. WG13]